MAFDAEEDPFTEQEHKELKKFMRVNNAKFYN